MPSIPTDLPVEVDAGYVALLLSAITLVVAVDIISVLVGFVYGEALAGTKVSTGLSIVKRWTYRLIFVLPLIGVAILSGASAFAYFHNIVGFSEEPGMAFVAAGSLISALTGCWDSYQDDNGCPTTAAEDVFSGLARTRVMLYVVAVLMAFIQFV